MSIYPKPKFLNSGESCLVVEFADEVDMGANNSVQFLKKRLEECLSSRILRECVPTYRSLAVNFDPLETAPERLSGIVNELLAGKTERHQADEREVVEIPVCYGGDFGPDLGFIASHAGLTEQEVVSRHAARTYYCYMLGFTPGFPYIGGMDESIAAPRLSSPRTHIPMGSVGIAGKQTGIYPIVSPGGWQLLGRTPLRLFNPDKNPVTLIQAGEWVRFIPISSEKYAVIEGSVSKGTYSVKRVKEKVK